MSNNQKIITLGPKFSYSYNVSAKYYQEKNINTANTIEEVFAKTTKNIHGIVPIENMLNGSVRETFLALQKQKVKIIKGFDYKIEHVLAGQDKNFQTVMSHAQPLIQCSKYLDTLRQQGIKIVETSSSSQAMQMAQKDKTVAAIGSKLAAKHYKMPIIRKKISNQNNNVTRFIEIKKGKLPTKGTMTSLIISPETDRSGLLFEILAVFKIKELNLTKIESIATGKSMNNYMFYLDLDGSMEYSRLQEAIKFLRTFVKVEVLGSYEIIKD